jgi:hypothetical protein
LKAHYTQILLSSIGAVNADRRAMAVQQVEQRLDLFPVVLQTMEDGIMIKDFNVS